MIAESGYDPNEEEELVATFLAHRVSGLVLHSTEHTPQTAAMIRKSGVPVVENGNIPAEPLDMVVSYSNEDAAHAMTMHLGPTGLQTDWLRKSVFDAQRPVEGSAQGLFAGARGARAGSGPPVDHRDLARSSGAGAETVARVVQSVPEVDALFCAGDVLAAGALFECQKRGWAVPKRIALRQLRRRRSAASRGAVGHDAAAAPLRHRRALRPHAAEPDHGRRGAFARQRGRSQVRDHSARKRVTPSGISRFAAGALDLANDRRRHTLLFLLPVPSPERLSPLLTLRKKSAGSRQAAVSGTPRRPADDASHSERSGE